MPSARSRNYSHGKQERDRHSLSKYKTSVKNLKSAPVEASETWTPSTHTAIKALLSARLCAALRSIIRDCDETYNYWEPTHFLLFGKGFQTWEYSPQYALRSYTYLLIHAVPAWLYSTTLQPNRVLVFFFIRCLLALLSSGSELYFYRYMTMMSMGAWFNHSFELAIFTTALSAFIGWPFAGVLGIPIALDIVVRRKQATMFFKWCCISAFTVLVPLIQIDSSYYGRLLVAPLNIVWYNIFTSHGPDLYGTESWSFYLFNGFLNFNFTFLAALLTPAILALLHFVPYLSKKFSTSLPMWLTLSPMYIWLVIFICQPHKEERFLFPVYPLVCLAAAVTLDFLQKMWCTLFAREKKLSFVKYSYLIPVMFLITTSLLGISRSAGQYRAYRAPLDAFMELHRIKSEQNYSSVSPVNVCMGKEWHRFPSSFFLPDLNWNLEFIRSEFRGQLPTHYSESEDATSVVPPNLNNINREEPSRYVNISSCHFLLDLDTDEESAREPRYSQQKDKWKIIFTVPFLDAKRSNRFLRAFYIPFLTEQYCRYLDYNLLQTTKWK